MIHDGGLGAEIYYNPDENATVDVRKEDNAPFVTKEFEFA